MHVAVLTERCGEAGSWKRQQQQQQHGGSVRRRPETQEGAHDVHGSADIRARATVRTEEVLVVSGAG